MEEGAEGVAKEAILVFLPTNGVWAEQKTGAKGHSREGEEAARAPSYREVSAMEAAEGAREEAVVEAEGAD
jgi:hypothetical protein